jgi:hypothetical protein
LTAGLIRRYNEGNVTYQENTVKADKHLAKLSDLGDQKPDGHRCTRLSTKRREFPTSGQVWVENVTDTLWRVTGLIDTGGEAEDCLVRLSAYSRPERVRLLRVPYLRSLMKVWERAVRDRRQFKRRRLGEYRRGEWDKKLYPTFEVFAQAFRFHPQTGFRID